MADDTSFEHIKPGPEDTTPARAPLPELTLGRSRPPADRSKPLRETTSVADFAAVEIDAIAARCRAKAGAARWAAERQRRIREGYGWTDEDAPPDPTIVEWSERLTDAFYWASASDSNESPDISQLDLVGGCFETVAESVDFVRGTEGRPSGLERALKLLAEAQSSLRRSLRDLQAPDDPDQLAVYEWLHATAARHRIYLKRFMRADDLADPPGWPGLLARIESAAGTQPQSKYQRTLFDELRSHLRHLTEQGGNTGRNWQAVFRSVQCIIDAGVPPSNRELRDLILPVIDELPDQDVLPPSVRLVVCALDNYLATRQSTSTAASPPVPTDDVQRAARLLAGRSLALIGGVRRPEAQRMLRIALGLKDLIWIETREHESIKRFASAVARPDVALVLLAIRWSSHAFGDVKQFCDDYGKPLVRLPGGYSPNQVAAQIILQAGGRLDDKSPNSLVVDRSSPLHGS
jgi:hypothetical protein